jgi:hypothetical protein
MVKFGSEMVFSIQNIIIFFSMLSPIFISSFLVLDSVFSSSPKGVFYIIGLLIAQIIGIGLRMSFRDPKNWKKWARAFNNGEQANHTRYGDLCDVFTGPFDYSLGHIGTPSTHAVFHAFTFFYILSSVVSNSSYNEGVPFLLFLAVTSILDFILRMYYDCDTITDIIVGIIVGLFGVGWYFVIRHLGAEYTYYNSGNNVKKCSLQKQKFKCYYK